MNKKYIIIVIVTFFLIFSIGYLFHEVLAFNFFKTNIGHITRVSYIIPFIAVSFFLYIMILTYLYPIFLSYYQSRISPLKIGILMGGIMGFLWDGLQGGLIEVATFTMPFQVFLLDSSYHVLEGIIAGLIIGVLYNKLK